MSRSGGVASKTSHSRPLLGSVTVLGGHKGPSDTRQKGHGLDLLDDGNPSRGRDGPRPYGLSELVYEALSYLCMKLLVYESLSYWWLAWKTALDLMGFRKHEV